MPTSDPPALQLSAYLARIGIARPVQADLAALRALHRAHLLAIPYENINVQLGRHLGLSAADAYGKIVTELRGGWCYEMNTLFGWALRELGFRVTRVAAAALRETRGDGAIGNHLVLLVALSDGLYLADVGFGDGPIDPVRIQAGEFTSHGVRFSLNKMDDGWWRLRNLAKTEADSFDFNLVEADERVLDEHCRMLQTSPTSTFVQNLVAIRFKPGGIVTLRGRTLQHSQGGAGTVRLLQSPEELVEVLNNEFGLNVPEAASLWPKIVARHEQLFGSLPEH